MTITPETTMLQTCHTPQGTIEKGTPIAVIDFIARHDGKEWLEVVRLSDAQHFEVPAQAVG